MTYDPETYWPARYQRQGDTYVAKGGRQGSHDAQVAAIVPYFEHLPSEGRVLDFGCGPGRFRPALEARGLEYEGVDLIPAFGTMNAADVEPESFDCVVALFVLQHVPLMDYGAAMGLLYGCLKPGGVLLVVDHLQMVQSDAHMHPAGFAYCRYRQPWSNAKRLGFYDDHWIGLFTR